MTETRRIDRPVPGYYLLKLTKGGAEIPARIWWCLTRHEPDEPSNLMDRAPFIAAEIAGDIVAVHEVWLRRGRYISRSEYEFRMADLAWAREHAQDEPQVNPKRAIDWLTVKI